MSKKKYKKREVNTNLYPALLNTKDGATYGYVNAKGKWIIKPKFQAAYDYNSIGNAIVEEGNLWGLINKEGNYVLNHIYEFINMFKEERATYTSKDGMGVIDESGNNITTKKYNFIEDYNEGRAVFSILDENNTSYYGYLDLKGNEVIPAIYSVANSFTDGFALVRFIDDKYGLIDIEGNLIGKYDYEYVSQYGDGLMVVSKSFGGPYGYIDKDGKEVIPLTYSGAIGFKNGVAIVSTAEGYNGPYGLIDKNGKLLYEPLYSNINILGEGRVALGMAIGEDEFLSRSAYAIGDTNGNKLTDFDYLEVGEYINGLAYVSDKTNTFFIDLSGNKEKSLPTVKGSGQLLLKDDLIYANIDYSPYYLDRLGKVVYKPNDEIKLDQTYAVIKDKYKPNINYLIYYPRVKGCTTKKVESSINKTLKEMSYFKPIGNDGQPSDIVVTENDVLNYNYYGTFAIQYYKKELLTLELSGYYYPLGAAHGMPSRKTPTLDLRTGQFFVLGNLFMGGVYWVGELNKIINNMIETDPQYEYVFKDDFKGIEPGQDFYIDDENLYIYFPPYAIGPYAAGFITFKIPFTEIQGMFNRQGAFYKLINA